MSVRGRFAATVAAAVALSVALFATLSIVAIDRALRSGVEARLRTAAQAVATTIDVHHGRIEVDASDMRDLAEIHADTPFAIFALGGRQLAGNAFPQMQQRSALAMATVPVTRDSLNAGSVTAWQSILWIGDFDRDAAIVSVAIGLVLVCAGAALSQRVARTFDRMYARLEAAFARERRFVADASHELRAPLAVLRAETELALRRPRVDQEYRDALASIARETARLEELVDGLLTAARADADARERRRIDAGELVRQVAERVRPAAAVRGVAVRVEIEGSAPAHANAATVERALLAILHNAIAFALNDGVVRLGVAHDSDTVRVEIADDGPGFSPEALEHATERFWRSDPSRPRGGTGLGLAIAHTLLEANGGTLCLANGPGGGALVIIGLPAA